MTVKYPPEHIVIRPPVEAHSLLIAVTGGCSWNKCKFCGTYKGMYGTTQDYALRPIEDIKEDIDQAAKYNYHGFPVFLAGGNPTSAPTDYLVKIIGLSNLRQRA